MAARVVMASLADRERMGVEGTEPVTLAPGRVLRADLRVEVEVRAHAGNQEEREEHVLDPQVRALPDPTDRAAGDVAVEPVRVLRRVVPPTRQADVEATVK